MNKAKQINKARTPMGLPFLSSEDIIKGRLTDGKNRYCLTGWWMNIRDVSLRSASYNVLSSEIGSLWAIWNDYPKRSKQRIADKWNRMVKILREQS